jgi:hypothetical protein
VKILIPVILMALLNISTGYADDLDDGISIDTPINDDLTLDKNINFIKRNAIAKARSKSKGGKSSSGCDGTGNIKIGAGSNLKGATIVNLSNNKGTTTVCDK